MDRRSVQNTTCRLHHKPHTNAWGDRHHVGSAVPVLRHTQPLPPRRSLLALLRRSARTDHLSRPRRTRQVPRPETHDGRLDIEESAKTSIKRRRTLRVSIRSGKTLVVPPTMAATTLPL